MPPFVTRKRVRQSSPPPPSSPRPKRAKSAPKGTKPTIFETVDAASTKTRKAVENRKLIDTWNADDESSLSEADSDDFEDVAQVKRRNNGARVGDDGDDDDGYDDDDDDDDDDKEMDWEDAIHPDISSTQHLTNGMDHEIGDISISVKEDGTWIEPTVTTGVLKKGPSKRERQARVHSHCLHVQLLMWHNTVRNSWLNDQQVQATLLDGLTDGVKRELTRWKESMGRLSKDELAARKREMAAAKAKGKRGKKGKQEAGRDWSYEAGHLEQGVPDISHGDPLLRLLKVLTAYWRKRFTVTAPGLRKQGYKDLRRIRDELKGWHKNPSNVEDYGERVENLQQFRDLAKRCDGSRDIGAQLFAALLRGIGLETRMVANLQPIGFGWSKNEDASTPKSNNKSVNAPTFEPNGEHEASAARAQRPKSRRMQRDSSPRSSGGDITCPIDLDDSGSALSSVPDEDELEKEDEHDDDMSVVDVTPPSPKKVPLKKYDRDVAFPNYWTEVCSPVSNKYIPVDPIVLSTIGSNEELIQSFEPRGKKAEQTKQVICYTTAFSADGTAKDVTIRYLKKHQLPGKTKGLRIPIEKVPIYNRKGKVRKYGEYDWFRTVMSIYDRPASKRTTADDLEDQTDLKPFKPAEKEKTMEKESLQWYRQSADYVLEQHLRREEAILPGAEPVRHFTAGKGDKVQEHPVYRRSEVVVCKTVESWHKEGRALKEGEQPLKLVPMRAVTLIRKREMEDAERETGEKLKQGLYSREQTDWIIPPPIKDGKIPKNAFGNMDVYVPTMVPQGAVHLPLKGSAKLCRKLEIDYAEACTGFEFGKQRAVPVLTGVVVAKEHERLVRDAWRADQEEARRKEDTKRTAASLQWWRKMLLSLRVIERMRVEYGDKPGDEKDYNPYAARAQRNGPTTKFDESIAGGSLAADHDDQLGHQPPRVAENDGQDDEAEHSGYASDEGTTGGGFLVEDNDADGLDIEALKEHVPITPVSLQSLHKPVNDGAEEDGSGSDGDNRETSVLAGMDCVGEDNDDTAQETQTVVSKSKARRISSRTPTMSRSKQPSTKSRPSQLQPHPRRTSGRRAAKVTPRKSHYFQHRPDEGTSPDADKSDLSPSSEDEVTKPRMTTARTRKV